MFQCVSAKARTPWKFLHETSDFPRLWGHIDASHVADAQKFA